MARSGKVEALILSRRNVGEADRLLTFFSREYGIITVMAKGVRRIPSRRGGHLELFTRVWGVIHGRGQKVHQSAGPYFLAGVETLDAYPDLHSDRAAREQVEVLSRAALCLLPPEEAQPLLYQHLARTWRVLPRVPVASRWLLEMGMLAEMLAAAGLAPQLAQCRVCREGQTAEAVVLDPLVGGWRCVTCGDSFDGTRYSLPPGALEVLRLLLATPREVFRLSLSAELVAQLHVAWRMYVSGVIEVALPAGGYSAPAYA